MEIVLLIGAAPHVLDETSAMWLEETIRQRWSDDTGRAARQRPARRPRTRMHAPCGGHRRRPGSRYFPGTGRARHAGIAPDRVDSRTHDTGTANSSATSSAVRRD